MTAPKDPSLRLRQVAGAARGVLLRVAGEGSVLEQIEEGQWAAAFTPTQADDVADVLDAMREHVRHSRAVIGSVGQPEDPARNRERAMLDLLASGLPLNRKERYYTGTVLPMIVASDGFAHLDRLLALCGLEPRGMEGNPLEGHQPLAFFTEYNFAESNYTAEDKARFPNAPTDADTPDIVIVGADWLLCIEAKVFHNPNAASLNAQMARQRVLVDYWAEHLNLKKERVAHVLLLPAGLAAHGVSAPVVTWESLLAAYRVVGPAYWTAMLATALARYNDLVSPSDTYGRNAEAYLTGTQIKSLADAGDLSFAFVGRSGGLGGPALQGDVSTDAWRTHKYEVRKVALPGNPNWFSVADFLTALPDA